MSQRSNEMNVLMSEECFMNHGTQSCNRLHDEIMKVV